jgi:uncharacterized protein (DUF433 family)
LEIEGSAKVVIIDQLKNKGNLKMTKVANIHIEITQGICGGKPRISGHRIRVEDIVIWHERMGLSTDEIVSQYPTITLGDVYSALAYYHDHFQEIRQQIVEDELAFAHAQGRVIFTQDRDFLDLYYSGVEHQQLQIQKIMKNC